MKLRVIEFGTKWQELSRKDLITGHTMGPDIEIESKKVSDARKARQAAKDSGAGTATESKGSMRVAWCWGVRSSSRQPPSGAMRAWKNGISVFMRVLGAEPL
jgi:hypothetical protein